MKGITVYLILSGFLCLLNQSLLAQEVTDPQELFSEGEFFFLAEEYEEALYFYSQLLEQFPENANYNFKVGITYLEIPGQEYKAIPFLEKAIRKFESIEKTDMNSPDWGKDEAQVLLKSCS